MSEEGLCNCYSYIQEDYQIFVPRESRLAETLIEEAHIQTIHGDINYGQSEIKILGSDIKAVSEKDFKNMLPV